MYIKGHAIKLKLKSYHMFSENRNSAESQYTAILEGVQKNVISAQKKLYDKKLSKAIFYSVN